MRYSRFFTLVYSIAAIGCASAWTPADTSKTDLLAAQALLKLGVYEAQGHTTSNCSLANAAVRREWYETSKL
jgi:hypothetical protein